MSLNAFLLVVEQGTRWQADKVSPGWLCSYVRLYIDIRVCKLCSIDLCKHASMVFQKICTIAEARWTVMRVGTSLHTQPIKPPTPNPQLNEQKFQLLGFSKMSGKSWARI